MTSHLQKIGTRHLLIHWITFINHNGLVWHVLQSSTKCEGALCSGLFGSCQDEGDEQLHCRLHPLFSLWQDDFLLTAFFSNFSRVSVRLPDQQLRFLKRYHSRTTFVRGEIGNQHAERAV